MMKSLSWHIIIIVAVIFSHGMSKTNRYYNPCNGLLTGDMNIIIYTNVSETLNKECIWNVLAPKDKQIQLTILKLVSYQTHLCNENLIQIYDVKNNHAYPVEQFCAINQAKIIISIFNEMLIKYQPYAGILKAFVRLAYEGYFNEPNGTLYSPFYPNQYPKDKDNIYIIKQPIGMRICLTFISFNIEYCDGCSCDYLEIHDGFRQEDPLIGKYCGTQISRTVISKSNSLWLNFKSNEFKQDFGFGAKYVAFQCGGLSTELYGTWTLPIFKNDFAGTVECFYVIKHKTGMAIAFSMKSDNPQFVQNCSQMSLSIHDGLNKDAPLIRQYCNDTSTIIYSQTNVLWIKFRFDASIELPLHIIHYNAFECGGKFTALEGNLKSPSYLNLNNLQDLLCIYLISIQSPTAYIIFHIDNFNFNSDCSLDYLEIRDGSDANASLIGHYCMTNNPLNITSTSNTLWIKFKSFDKYKLSSFHGSYSAHNICGGEFSEQNGILQSPQLGLFNNQSSQTQDCFYIIKPSLLSIVHLIFTIFDIEYYPNCIYEYLEIINGSSTNKSAQQIGKYCGHKSPGKITVETNALSLHLRTYNPLYSKGFQAVYIISSKMFSEPQGVFSSLLLPFDLKYIYIIKRELGCLIEAVFYFDTEYETNFTTYNIEIRIGDNQNDPLLKEYYNLQLFPLISVKTNSLWIKLTPPKLLNRREFSISYSISDCIYMFSEEVGTLMFPSYEGETKSNIKIHECHYKINWVKNRNHNLQGPSNIVITIIFDYFISSFDCNNEFMEIETGNNSNHSMLNGKYCHHTAVKSNLIIEDDIFLKIRIKSRNFASKRKLAYYIVSNTYCGGIINQIPGVLRLPLYNDSWEDTMVCNYLIIGKKNSKILLINNKFNIESFDTSIELMFLEIRDGSNEQAPLLGKYCNDNVPPKYITSTSPFLLLRFQFYSNLAESEFEIKYENVNVYTNRNGELFSPGYPHLYPNNFEEIYIIKAEPSCFIHLTFDNFHLETSECRYDFLQINDVFNESSPIIGKFCGQTIPGPITSKSNILKLQFISDSSQQFSGFKISYFTSCENNCYDYTLENGAISYLSSTENGSLCSEVRIILPEMKYISLFFSYFSLGDNANCENNFLEIREGDSKFGFLIGRYCGSELPLPIYTGNKIWMKLNINSSSIARKLYITYTSSSHVCGGNLTGWHGTFANPTYYSNISCEWVIWAPFGRRAHLRFKKFIFIDEDDCSNNYIEVRDGATEQSPLIDRYCGPYYPRTIASKNVLYVKFTSRLNSNVNAFTAVYFY